MAIADQAAAALDRLSQREDFTSPDDYVFCNALGAAWTARPCDAAATSGPTTPPICARSAGMASHRTFGSLLVAGGVDLVSIKDAMGHSQLTTTSRSLHARPATERAAAFTAAFRGTANTASYSRGRDSLEQPDEP